MHFRPLFLLALAPFALASPEAQPNPVAAPAPAPSGLLDLLGSAEGLLSQSNIDNLDLIIVNAAKLLSDDNLDILQNILNNANTLLTPQFVKNTTELIGDATPMVADLATLLGSMFT
jgi:hypothetical protein